IRHLGEASQPIARRTNVTGQCELPSVRRSPLPTELDGFPAERSGSNHCSFVAVTHDDYIPQLALVVVEYVGNALGIQYQMFMVLVGEPWPTHVGKRTR